MLELFVQRIFVQRIGCFYFTAIQAATFERSTTNVSLSCNSPELRYELLSQIE